MKIKWLGHAAFLLEASNGTRIITDPYQSGSYSGTLKYGPIKETADIVTLSHHHPDHGYTEDIDGDPLIIDEVVSNFKLNGTIINGFKVFHDQVGGNKRGENIIFSFSLEDMTICHLGDLGHMLSDELINILKPVDVLLIPVGGTATINASQAERLRRQLDAVITIPMHFHNEKCLFKIDPVDNFLFGKTSVINNRNSEIEVTAGKLPDAQEIVVLRPVL